MHKPNPWSWFKIPIGIVFLLHCATVVIAQTRAIKGTVRDAKQKALPSVTVQVKGTQIIAVTDDNGQFAMNVPTTANTLILTSVGYKLTEVPINTAGDVTIIMQAGESKLDEVVVVGYGTQKKANLTGAVDQVGTEFFEDRPVPNAVHALQGAMPNLNIQISDGKPIRNPAMNIRGTTSIGAGGQALVLIDGVQGNLIDINPNDIESVTTLKDAASAAIYGARGAFGVVLVTTKRPGKSAPRINYNGNYSIKQRTTTPKWVNDGYTWAKYFNESYLSWTDYVQAPKTVNTFFPFSPQYLDELKQRSETPEAEPEVVVDNNGNYIYYGNTDWQKLLYKDNIPGMEHSLNISGASDKMDYIISGRYYAQDGIFKYNTDNLDKFNFRIKGGVQAKSWLRITNNTDISAFKYSYPLQSLNQYDVWTNLKLYGFPMATLLNPDGTLTQAAANNGVGELYWGKSRSKRNQLFVRNTVSFAATALQHKMNIKGDFTFQHTSNVDERRLAPVQFSAKQGVLTTAGANSLNNNSDKTNYYAANLYGDYTERFGGHTIKLLVGGNYETNRFRNLEVQRDEVIVDNRIDFNLAVGQNYKVAGGASEWATLGSFGRINYDYKNKYLLEINGRYDGASKFPSSEQYVFFPSVSAGWNIASEEFMERTANWLNVFKVRASYGSLGNSQISPYMYEALVGAARSSVIINDVYASYLTQPPVLAEGFTWEKATTFDLGVDVELFNRRFSASFDYYQRKTTDMIVAGQELPAVFGAASPRGNLADLTTKGFELTVNWNDRIETSNKPIIYSVRAILSDNVATIDKFYNPKTLITNYYPGARLGDIWGYVADGLYQNDAEIAAGPNQNFIQLSTVPNKLYPGDLRFKDLNGDKVINRGINTLDSLGDQTIIGNSTPRYTYGFTTNWSWNNITVSAFIQGVGKRSWYPGHESGIFWGQYTRWYGQVPQHTIDGTWTRDDPQPNSYFPRYRGPMTAGGRELGYPVDRYLQDVSYVRLKDISIGYSLPQHWIGKIGMQNARVYFSGQNLWTYSPMYKLTRDIDPEVIEGSDPEIRSDMGQGAAYPMLKTYTFGLNLTF